ASPGPCRRRWRERFGGRRRRTSTAPPRFRRAAERAQARERDRERYDDEEAQQHREGGGGVTRRCAQVPLLLLDVEVVLEGQDRGPDLRGRGHGNERIGKARERDGGDVQHRRGG